MLKRFFQTKLGKKIDKYIFERNIHRLTEMIFQIKKGTSLEVTQDEARTLALNVIWNQKLT